MGRDGAGDAVRSTAILHRLPEAGRSVRRLGGGLSAVADQPQCTAQARPARHRAVVRAGGSSSLRAHHCAAVRSGEPTIAWDGEGSQRGCGATRGQEDGRGERPDLAAKPPGLLHRTVAGRAVGAGHGQHSQAALRAPGRRRTGLQPTQTRPSLTRLSHLHAVEPAAGAAGGCAARRPVQRVSRDRRTVDVARSSRSSPAACSAARRQAVGHRAGDGAGGT